MSSFLFQNTIISIQVTFLLGMHHYSHVLPHTIIPIQLTLLGMHCCSHVLSQSFSKAVALTIAVKVLGMLQHTNPLSLSLNDTERLLFSLASCQNAQYLRSKSRQKGDQFFYQMFDFCENCNPHSSYHTTAVGKCLVDIWFAEICQLTLCVFANQFMLSKSTCLLYGSSAHCRFIQCCMYM